MLSAQIQNSSQRITRKCNKARRKNPLKKTVSIDQKQMVYYSKICKTTGRQRSNDSAGKRFN